MSASNAQLRVVAHMFDSGAGTLPPLVNLSHGALLVRSNVLFIAKQRVTLTIVFESSGRELQVEAEIIWTNEKLGDMALQFVSLDEAGRDLIASYLAERSRKNPGRS